MTRSRSVLMRWLLAGVALLVVAGCGSPSVARPVAPAPSSAASPAASPVAAHHHPGPAVAGDPVGQIVVAADETLRTPLTTLARLFPDSYPQASIVLRFGRSDELARQVTAHRDADVLITAGPPLIQRAVAAGAVHGSPAWLARDTLVIVTRPGGSVRRLGDLSGARVALCDPSARCGVASARVLTHVRVAPVLVAPDARSALAAVAAGKADATLVYRSEVTAARLGLAVRDSDESAPAAERYSIASVHTGRPTTGADAFAGFATSVLGRSLLNEAGFGPP
ncbi:MAG: molybdate transport system substrate-binding protein [Cryptosporangiaceae bacterium]|nr:molybdate transport system substrate-binding protein [Cryptosporangiaceae bacterium]